MHVDPNSPRAGLTKRQEQVLERLTEGQAVKKIAKDIGISRAAVYQHIDRLRRQGALAETYTPSGQPPRRAPDTVGAALPAAGTAPRDSALADLRRLAEAGGDESAYASLIERAIASADAVALAYELGRLDALGAAGLPSELVESALRRLSVLPARESDPGRR
jgi:DNA-binding CsgD family transcriptional regulator